MAWRQSRRFRGRPFRRGPRLFRRQWLKLGVSPRQGMALHHSSSAYNTNGGDPNSLLHRAAILGDITPAAAVAAQTPRDLRDQMRITALRGTIHVQAPVFADPSPVRGTLWRTIEGIIRVDWPTDSSLVVNAAGTLSPANTNFGDERWLWRREMMCEYDDYASGAGISTEGSRMTGRILPMSMEEIHIEPKILLKENETLVYMIASESMAATSPHAYAVNSELAEPGTAWVNLRVLSWARN